MKKTLLSIAAFAALIGTPAVAADMAVKAPPLPPVAAYSWTGFYGGLNAGGGWGGATNSYNFVTPAGFVTPIANDSSHPSGFIGGGQLGYNWQINSWLFGLETDMQGSTQKGSTTVSGAIAACGVPCLVSATDKVTWFGTTRGRIGLASGSWLTYVTGGVAYGGVQSNGILPLTGIAAVPTTGGSTTRAGWTIGGGVEAAITGKWTWKIEYLYMDLGTANFAVPLPAPAFVGGIITQTMHVTDNIVRGGVNYRF